MRHVHYIISLFFIFLLIVLQASCVNGIRETGTPVNPDSIPPRDSVSQLSPNGDDFMLIEGMNTCMYETFFEARVDEIGDVYFKFKDFDNERFATLFSVDCPRIEVQVENLEGRCCGVTCLNDVNGTDPILFMIMDDGHVERIMLSELSDGKTLPTMRSEQEGIISVSLGTNATGSGKTFYGMQADSSRVELMWQK